MTFTWGTKVPSLVNYADGEDAQDGDEAAFEYHIEEIERAATATWESLDGIEHEPDQTYDAYG